LRPFSIFATRLARFARFARHCQYGSYCLWPIIEGGSNASGALTRLGNGMANSWGKITRRGFLAGSIAAAGTGFYTWRIEPHWYEVVERELPIAGLPAELNGKRLVQLNDLHVGGRVDSAYLKSALKHVGRMEADLIALVGDFMTCHGSEYVDEVARVMESLPTAKLGNFAVLGNHDYGSDSWSDTQAAAALVRRLTQAGITVLKNDSREVAGLQIFGVDDVWGPDFSLRRALAKYDSAKPALMLCHNPDGCDHDGWKDFRGWILSGHTHGGQCRLPFCDPPILPVGNRRYVAGEYALDDGRMLYINRGLGHHLRVRFMVRPEITVFTLRPGGIGAAGATGLPVL
jgi:predicted MPP superfamily phosphohydrolase